MSKPIEIVYPENENIFQEPANEKYIQDIIRNFERFFDSDITVSVELFQGQYNTGETQEFNISKDRKYLNIIYNYPGNQSNVTNEAPNPTTLEIVTGIEAVMNRCVNEYRNLKDMDRKFVRVFFHELGHFVANEMIYRKYGFRKSEKMFLTYSSAHDDFVGGVKPEGRDDLPDAQVVNYAEYLLALTYGCLFETYKDADVSFDDCFDYDGHGHKDVASFVGHLSQAVKGKKRIDQVWDLLNHHVETMNQMDLLDDLRKIDGRAFISSQIEDDTNFDLDSLREAVYPYLDKIEKVFLPFLEEIRMIIDQSKKEKLENTTPPSI